MTGLSRLKVEPKYSYDHLMEVNFAQEEMLSVTACQTICHIVSPLSSDTSSDSFLKYSPASALLYGCQ